jgi:putative hemolysin
MSEIMRFQPKNRLETAQQKKEIKCKNSTRFSNSPNKFFVNRTNWNYSDRDSYWIYSGDKITTDVQTFIQGFEILKPYAPAVGLVVVVTFFSR